MPRPRPSPADGWRWNQQSSCASEGSDAAPKIAALQNPRVQPWLDQHNNGKARPQLEAALPWTDAPTDSLGQNGNGGLRASTSSVRACESVSSDGFSPYNSQGVGAYSGASYTELRHSFPNGSFSPHCGAELPRPGAPSSVTSLLAPHAAYTLATPVWDSHGLAQHSSLYPSNKYPTQVMQSHAATSALTPASVTLPLAGHYTPIITGANAFVPNPVELRPRGQRGPEIPEGRIQGCPLSFSRTSQKTTSGMQQPWPSKLPAQAVFQNGIHPVITDMSSMCNGKTSSFSHRTGEAAFPHSQEVVGDKNHKRGRENQQESDDTADNEVQTPPLLNLAVPPRRDQDMVCSQVPETPQVLDFFPLKSTAGRNDDYDMASEGVQEATTSKLTEAFNESQYVSPSHVPETPPLAPTTVSNEKHDMAINRVQESPPLKSLVHTSDVHDTACNEAHEAAPMESTVVCNEAQDTTLNQVQETPPLELTAVPDECHAMANNQVQEGAPLKSKTASGKGHDMANGLTQEVPLLKPSEASSEAEGEVCEEMPEAPLSESATASGEAPAPTTPLTLIPRHPVARAETHPVFSASTMEKENPTNISSNVFFSKSTDRQSQPDINGSGLQLRQRLAPFAGVVEERMFVDDCSDLSDLSDMAEELGIRPELAQRTHSSPVIMRRKRGPDMKRTEPGTNVIKLVGGHARKRRGKAVSTARKKAKRATKAAANASHVASPAVEVKSDDAARNDVASFNYPRHNSQSAIRSYATDHVDPDSAVKSELTSVLEPTATHGKSKPVRNPPHGTPAVSDVDVDRSCGTPQAPELHPADVSSGAFANAPNWTNDVRPHTQIQPTSQECETDFECESDFDSLPLVLRWADFDSLPLVLRWAKPVTSQDERTPSPPSRSGAEAVSISEPSCDYKRAKKQISTMMEVVSQTTLDGNEVDDDMRVAMLQGLSAKHAGKPFWHALLDSESLLETLLKWFKDLVPQPKQKGTLSTPSSRSKRSFHHPNFAYAAPLCSLLQGLLEFLPNPADDDTLGAKLAPFAFDEVFCLIERRARDKACEYLCTCW